MKPWGRGTLPGGWPSSQQNHKPNKPLYKLLRYFVIAPQNRLRQGGLWTWLEEKSSECHALAVLRNMVLWWSHIILLCDLPHGPPKHRQAHNSPLSCKQLPDMTSWNVLSSFPSQSHKSITCPVNSEPTQVWRFHHPTYTLFLVTSQSYSMTNFTHAFFFSCLSSYSNIPLTLFLLHLSKSYHSFQTPASPPSTAPTPTLSTTPPDSWLHPTVYCFPMSDWWTAVPANHSRRS